MKKEKLEIYFLFALILTISFMHSRKMKEKEMSLRNIEEKNNQHVSAKSMSPVHVVSVSYK